MEPLITPELLASTGIKLPDDEIDAYLEHLNELLSERIGESIAESLEEEKLEELSTLQETASDEELSDWLQENVADLDQIIEDEIDILIGEAVENSGKINELDKTEEGAA